MFEGFSISSVEPCKQPEMFAGIGDQGKDLQSKNQANVVGGHGGAGLSVLGFKFGENPCKNDVGFSFGGSGITYHIPCETHENPLFKAFAQELGKHGKRK
uniref:Uncharacterized protein n=1 Tax=Panagrolaimus sp. ES5 TaxID=591445 RepID=A0AC34FYZ3_9BILA